MLGLEESILGPSNRRADQIRHVIRGGSPRTFDVLNRKWLVSRDGAIYHYVFYDPERLELNGLSVYDLGDQRWRLERRTYASQVAFRDGVWRADHGWFREFEDVSAPLRFERFQATALPLESPDYFVTEHPDAERMTYSQLQRYIVDLQAGGFNVVPYLVALQRKLSFPFVTIVMTLLAVPFAVTTGSRGTLYGVGIGLVLALSYWVIVSVFGAIGNAGLLAPRLAAWAPNVLFSGGAAYLLLGVRT
jgi:lipopolysaccharide export LptBFGC system permease protein LptF